MFGFGVFIEFDAGENRGDATVTEVVANEDAKKESQLLNGDDLVFPFVLVVLVNRVVRRDGH